jgi:hypothetical protein
MSALGRKQTLEVEALNARRLGGSAARTRHFASCDARNSDFRPLGTPDRTVAIPHGRRSALKALARRNDFRRRARWQYQVPADDRDHEANKETGWTHSPKMSPVQRLMCVESASTVT